ncbi:DUF1801 domain-containing protein [Chitinophaga sp. Cy-1792]|uniref:DUF1801 domain-containing protein n=1 Tax=Chitinophaga sp. Cy-1792 TaxID=2608339 RepID=UPI001966CA95|nr:DUF1801 domain-containing protein [Chitinophaga sp. Cy-1792]NIG53404.1 hypothetical protein [Chitinophaga sp. Cy-1792]
MESVQPANIDAYIAAFPAEVKDMLEKIRAIIRKAAPLAFETISYGIPTFDLNGHLVHFAGYKSHIGFYPGAGAMEHFEKELTHYKTSKGTVQLPLNEPLPAALITAITRYRIEQNLGKTKKSAVKKAPEPTFFVPGLAAPARRALENKGITTLKQLADHTLEDIMLLHGMGKSSVPKMTEALAAAGLQFKG